MEQGLEKQFSRWELGKFVLPTVLMMMFMSLYTVVDGIFVSRLVGSNALSAINITMPVTSVVYGVAIMFATGGCAIVATHLGEGEKEKARKRFSFIVYVVAGVGCAIGGIGLFFVEPINTILGASDAIRGYANDYLRILLLFTPITMVKVLFEYFVVAEGKPMLGFGLSLVGGIINMVLDYVLIDPLGMGIAGAAWATIIGQLIPMLIAGIFFMRKKNNLYLTKPDRDLKVLRDAMANGSSEMVTNLASGVITFFFNITMMKLLGEDGVAAVTVVLYAHFLLTAGYLGFTSGVAPVISFKYGNNNQTQLRKIIRYCYQFVLGASIMTLVVSYMIAPQLVSAFVDKGTAVYDIAVEGFSIFAIGFLFTGINTLTSGMFTAFSNGKLSAFISMLRTFVLVIGALCILPSVMGVAGVWLAIPVAEGLTCIIALKLVWRYRKVYGYR